MGSVNLSSPRKWTAITLEVLFKEEARILEQQENAKGLKIPLDQILSEGLYSDPQDQALYDDHTLSLCSTAALNAWDRIQEL